MVSSGSAVCDTAENPVSLLRILGMCNSVNVNELAERCTISLLRQLNTLAQ